MAPTYIYATSKAPVERLGSPGPFILRDRPLEDEGKEGDQLPGG